MVQYPEENNKILELCAYMLDPPLTMNFWF